MSEMLGNQYFMARNYVRAIPLLEKVLAEETNNHNCRKKLIICYTQAGNYNKAWKNFEYLINKDPYIIINTEPDKDDCPCPEIVDQMQRRSEFENKSTKFLNELGMLCLYCDIRLSIDYFKKSIIVSESQPNIRQIIKLLGQLALKSA